MTAKSYETLSINDLDAILDRLTVALTRPNVSNRAQVGIWFDAALRAYKVAHGLEVRS